MSNNKRALMFLIDGNEESEIVNTVDVLRRADIEVTLAGVEGTKPISCSQCVTIVPDVGLDQIENEIYDIIIVPGGPGADKFKDNEIFKNILKKHYEMNKIVAAICSGTKILNTLQIGYGKSITSYPKFVSDLENNYRMKKEKVVVDGNLVTSQGPGTALEFGLRIVELALNDKNKVNEVAEQLAVF